MLFQKRIDRAFDLLKEKNNVDDSNIDSDYREEDKIELEREDHIALFLSALIVFGPIFLVLIGILLFVAFI